jgi:phospholipid/cholesterol/gamma-HCH transport system substrate-binding protein
MKSINAILAQTDAEGRNLINNLSHTAKSIGDTATELRSSNVIGNAARAMADADKTILDADKVVLSADKVMANANGFSKDLADMAAYMRQGRGTMGGIIMDPILYERLLTILGGVERSRILRAVVRYAITKSDPPVVAQSITEPAVPPPPKPLVPAKSVPATK